MADGADATGGYVSRGGVKLEHALREIPLDVSGLRCADLGCSTGGFVDCLLRHGAAEVIAVDTGYGVLAWRLRSDPRVTVRERENALHAAPSDSSRGVQPGVEHEGLAGELAGGLAETQKPPVDLVTIDLGWTPQRLAVPAALRWIGADGRILTLIKPHYEATDMGLTAPRGGLPDDLVACVLERVERVFDELGVVVEALVESPIRGAKSSRRGAGNREFFAALRRGRPAGRSAAATGAKSPA